MMSPAEFVTRTTFPRCGRGSELRAIDARLQQVTPIPADNDAAVHGLIGLLSAIKRWKIVKEKKRSGDDWSDVHRARFGALNALESQVMGELQARAGTGGESGSLAMAARSASYERHKAAGAHKGLRGLGDGYAHERTQFEQQKKSGAIATKGDKAVPLGASAISESARNVTKKPDQYRPLLGDALTAKLNGLDMHKLKYKDFIELAEDLAKNPGAALQESRVHFARKTERLERFLTWVDNGLFYKQPGTPYSTPHNSPDLYAMDKYGNLVTMPSSLYYNLTAGNYDTGNAYRLAQHNHSSLNAGADVISAGMIAFNQGFITYIDNNSGHYKPSARDLQHAVRSLIDADSADVSQLVVRVMEMVRGQLRESTYNNAAVFARQRL